MEHFYNAPGATPVAVCAQRPRQGLENKGKIAGNKGWLNTSSIFAKIDLLQFPHYQSFFVEKRNCIALF